MKKITSLLLAAGLSVSTLGCAHAADKPLVDAAKSEVPDATSQSKEGVLPLNDPAQFEVSNGSLESKAGVLRWQINNGQTSTLSLTPALTDQVHNYDLLQFEMRVVSGEISTIEVNALGNLDDGRRTKIANWTTAVSTMPHDEWQPRTLVLSRPAWFPPATPDGSGGSRYFRFESLAITPGTVVEFRNMRFTRALVYLKPDYQKPITWPRKTVNADGSVSYILQYPVLNTSDRPDTITAKVLSTNPRFKVALAKAELPAKNGQLVTFTLTATLSKDDIAATKELYREPLDVEFAPKLAPQAGWVWHGDLVRPLSPGIHRQVIASSDNLKVIREKIAAGDAVALQMSGLKYLQPMADVLTGVRFAELPGGHGTIHNVLPKAPDGSALAPGAFMPEIVNTKTGEREVGTPLANLFWKEYMAQGKGAESLALSYLYTNDEKYAQKGTELFQLFGDQYQYLEWNSQFNLPWNLGDMNLSSSRYTKNVTYGTNWFLKWHMRLLSAIAESPSWEKLDAAQKEKIYNGFALPFATELMKFPATVSNQNDITNGNLLQLGLVFDDANLVYRALYSDAGLLRRINDITPDGFSSEGRPLNYHYASMEEYLPALVYLENSGLKIDFPKDRLLAATKMPYLRAALNGEVPSSGDSGRGNGHLTTRGTSDYLFAIFPQEKWLYDIGRLSTPAAQAHFLTTGVKPDPDAWKKLVSSKPYLFPDGGMAILRSGDTPETQIQLTLDYGRNVFHGALDRNQIDLQAFGQTFTQGTSSLYNAGSGGITYNQDPKLRSFMTHGSLGQNVVLVDQEDQEPAIGKLLAWSTKPDKQYAVAKVDEIAPGVSHTRGAVLTRGVVILLDRVTSAQEHSYDWVYHNYGEMKPVGGWTASPVAAPLGTTANYDNLVDVQQLKGNGVLHLDWDMSQQVKPVTGKAVPEVSTSQLSLWQLPVAGGEAYTAFTGMNNTNTGIMSDKTPTLIRRVRGKNAFFATVLEPRKTATSIIKSIEAKGAAGVLVTFTDGTKASFDLDELIKTGVEK